MNIFGGHADFVHANNFSTLNVSGGTFGSFWAHDSSTVTVCGGSHHSVVTISGTGFNYPYGEIPDTSGTLTGVLANGDPINASFEIYDNASIVLVPEQAALVLLSIGAAGLVSWARVRRSRPRCTGIVCVSVPRSLAALVAGALVLGLAGPLQASWFLTWLDPLPGDDSGLPYAVSADGSTIVGQSSRGAYHSDYRPEAFRWTPSGGMAGLGFLPGHAWSEAHGVSADGTVVVGYSQAAIGEHMHAGGEAFRWTEDTGPVGLGHLQGDDLSWAYGVSADGSVVVGYSGNMGWNDTAFLWTRQGKMTALPLPAGGAWSRAMAVSATGSVVAGEWGTDNSHEGIGALFINAFAPRRDRGRRHEHRLGRPDLVPDACRLEFEDGHAVGGWVVRAAVRRDLCHAAVLDAEFLAQQGNLGPRLLELCRQAGARVKASGGPAPRVDTGQAGE